jgi:hypothetical protein
MRRDQGSDCRAVIVVESIVPLAPLLTPAESTFLEVLIDQIKVLLCPIVGECVELDDQW